MPTTASRPVRVLLVADTHIGFDLPVRPRVERRRRGHDFLACFDRALQPAYEGQVDAVVHGGDLLFRARVPAALVDAAMLPLVRVAEHGVPVFLVPGNHERGRIPPTLFAAHRRLHVFREPGTVVIDVRGLAVAVSGFPYARDVGRAFAARVEATGHARVAADIKALCMHQIVEGARVGPAGFTFHAGADVVRGREIPAGFAVVLSGHIHRGQVLVRDLAGRELAAPVVYPGSVERTAFAEAEEEKRYALVDLAPGGATGGRLAGLTFVPLPARPMVTIDVPETDGAADDLATRLCARLRALPDDAVVRVRASAATVATRADVLTAARLRRLAPPTMNVSLQLQPASGAPPRLPRGSPQLPSTTPCDSSGAGSSEATRSAQARMLGSASAK